MAKEKFNFIQPFKDIPNVLKGFPKNLIHIWKDPVENSEQIAERKKAIFAYIYLFAGAFLLLAALAAFIQPATDILTIVAIVPGAGVAAGVFLLMILKKAQQKFADLECTNCKTRIKYNPNVQIDVLDKQFTLSKEKQPMSSQNTSEMYVKIVGKEFTKARITCKCQECGTEKSFEHTFVTVECEKFENRIHFRKVDEYLLQYEADVRADAKEGFEGKKGTTARGVKITHNRSIGSLVAGYFGNEIQMR